MSEPARVRSTPIRYPAAIVVLTAIWLAMLLLGGGPLDRTVYQALYVGGHPALVMIARALTTLGEPTVLIAAGLVTAVLLWRAGHRHLPWVLIAVTMLGRGVSELQKFWVARARPDLDPHLVVVKTSSFPSGHAASSMIFYLTLALALTAQNRWRWFAAACAVILSILIGTSRVMLGVHWPSDVVGGWAFGALWVLLTLRRAERLFKVDSNTIEGRT